MAKPESFDSWLSVLQKAVNIVCSILSALGQFRRH